jgi:hypothetical protein
VTLEVRGEEEEEAPATVKVGVVGLGECGVRGMRVVQGVGVGTSASTAILVLHIGIQFQEDLGKLRIFLECWGNNVWSLLNAKIEWSGGGGFGIKLS